MDNEAQAAANNAATLAEVSTRFSGVFLRIAISQSIVNSALEVPQVFDVVQERSLESHRSGQSGMLDILLDRQIIEGVSSREQLDPFLEAIALQTTVNAEIAISAAAVILSRSAAEDAFTAACQMAIDLDPKEWVSELNLKRTVSLETLKERGTDRVFTDELRFFRDGLGGKSIVKRADLLFAHVPIRLHGEIPKEHVAYFRLSRLKEMDELRHNIVHSNGLQRVRLKEGTEAALFFHEAAHTALRSLANYYGFTLQPEVLFKSLTEKGKA
jgi:hypothetical protein